MSACLSPPPTDVPRPGARRPVAADALRIGQVVRIGLPWSSHPFPVSEFRIDDAVQLAAVRAMAAGCVLGAPPSVNGAAGGVVVAPPSRHARRVLAALAGRCGGGAPLPGGRRTAATADGWVDPSLCRRQLVEAAGDARALGRLLSSSADSGLAAVSTVDGGPRNSGWLPHTDAVVVGADALQAATRLAHALSTKLTGLPSAYIRALYEDGVHAGEVQAGEIRACEPQAGAARPVFPRTLRVAVLALLLARAVELDAAARHDVLLGALLPGLDRPAAAQRVGEAGRSAAGRSAADRHREDAGLPELPAGGSAQLPQRLAPLHDPPAAGGGLAGGLAPRPPSRRPPSPPARIVALVEHYEALCLPAPPATGLAPHLALARLRDDDRTPFDAPLRRAFVRLMGVYPPGSLVRLSDERYARVVGFSRARPLRPPTRSSGRDADPEPDPLTAGALRRDAAAARRGDDRSALAGVDAAALPA